MDEAGRTHCRNGHEFTPGNTYLGGGRRSCRRCNADAQARRKIRRGPQPKKPRNPRKTPVEDRFWSKVDRSGECWQWTAGLNSDGYAQIRDGEGRWLKAHRFSYELHRGPIPTGMDIDHTCWNRACVNPEHLRLATRKQNSEHLQGARSSSTTGVLGVYLRGPRHRSDQRGG